MNVECRFVAYEGDVSVVAQIVERDAKTAIDRLSRADGRFKKLGAGEPVGIRNTKASVTPIGKIAIATRPAHYYDLYSVPVGWQPAAIDIPHGFFTNKPSWKMTKGKIEILPSVFYELDHRKKMLGW